MEHSRVTIITPTFNRAELLPRAIESVLRQKYTNWELIIVDDGSNDETKRVVLDYVNKDNRIVYIYKNNSGPAESRNKGIASASGNFITYLDSDDEYLPEHLSLRIDFMQKHDADFIHGEAIVIGDDDVQFVPDRRNPDKLIHISDCIVGGTFFAKAGVITGAGGWIKGYGEDAHLFDRVKERYTVQKVHFRTYLYHRETLDSRCSTMF